MALSIRPSEPGVKPWPMPFDIDRIHLEIGDGVQFLVLLSQRQKVADPAEVGVVFEADEPVLPEIARKPQCGSEFRRAARPEADVHDRIGDELPLGVAHSDNRPYLQVQFHGVNENCDIS